MKNFLITYLLFVNFSYAQEYPQDFFVKPLVVDLSMNGSFGELRYNHFHSGIDLGTNRKEGDVVLASADGEVVRIQINEKGYGKALYLKHANGYTSVYGHLNEYAKPIADFVKKNQYKENKYIIELFPLKNELFVKKGDVIGFVGNTGSSSGPHLHYEIRDTQTEEIINPLLFGFQNWIIDTEKPIINSLVVYPISKKALVNSETQPLILSLNKIADGVYISQKVSARDVIGFGVNAYDVMNNRYSKNGVYKIEAFVNGSINFQIVFDRFNFDETRKINLYVDYYRLNKTKERVQKLFKNSNYQLSLIKTSKNNGQIEVLNGDSYNYKIVISDFHSNKTEINIPIVFDPSEIYLPNDSTSGLKKIDAKRDYILSENNGILEWDALTFYEDCELDLRFNPNEIVLHKDEIPIDKNILIKFDISNSGLNPDKTFIALVKGNTISYFHTWNKNNVLSTRTKSLGTYKLIEDFDAPTISSKNFSENNTYKTTDVLTFEVDDTLSGIKEINGYLNGHWALFEYDYKTKQISHQLKDGIAQIGSNKLLIKVSDHVGNNATFESNFQLN